MRSHSLVYWVELFAEFGEAGLAWGLAGPFYTLIGGVLGSISNTGPKIGPGVDAG